MKRLRTALVLAALMVVASISVASAQAINVDFVTAITYQNISSDTATVTFRFYNEKTGTFTPVTRQLNADAGSSLFVGGLSGGEELSAGFLGSAVLSSDKPIVATLVQIPQSNDVKNRPLSNGFSSGSSSVLLSTVLKNQFNTSSRFSIQNASTTDVDLTVNFFAVGDPNPITITESNIPQGSAAYFEAGDISQLPTPFNGSAVVTAVESGTSTPADIVGSVLELQTNNVGARAFEGVNNGASTVSMATALCERFGTTTFYAVQNVSASGNASVTVDYKNLDGSSAGTETASIVAGGKNSFNACDTVSNDFSGAATITSTGGDIVVIGKVGGNGRYTAFLGENSGADDLALPYVRYSPDARFNDGSRQRAFIAIQNIGSSTASNVNVRYLDKNGSEVGVHTISSIAPGAKQNSNATLAGLTDFGTPESNPGGGFGGSVIVDGPDGSELIAVVRISSNVSGNIVAEDYNGISLP